MNASGGALNTTYALGVGTVLSVAGQTAGGDTGAYIVRSGGTLSPTAWTWAIGASLVDGCSASGFMTKSDGRAKSDIEDITADEAVDWIMRGRPRKFMMDGTPRTGFIAQEEVANGHHDAVTTIKDDDPKFVESDGVAPAGHRLSRDYNHDVAYLTAALQAALACIEVLEAKVATP